MLNCFMCVICVLPYLCFIYIHFVDISSMFNADNFYFFYLVLNVS